MNPRRGARVTVKNKPLARPDMVTSPGVLAPRITSRVRALPWMRLFTHPLRSNAEEGSSYADQALGQ
jgi:hypothetical protein